MSTEPDWSLFRSFLAVLEDGSLSAAARRLGLTQPTIARQVDALERLFGTALFLRTQRGLLPTALALDLRPYARSLAATAAAMTRMAGSAAEQVQGTVRVSASDIVGTEHLLPILGHLRRSYPRLAVELVLSDAVDDLLRRDADIAVRQVEPAQDALVARRLPPITLGLHARRDYLDRKGVPSSLDALAGHDLIGFDRSTPALRALVARFPALNRDAFALRVDSNLAQFAAIRAGLGIGLCQVLLAGRHPALVRVLADAVAPTLGTWVVMHEDLRASTRCRAVFDALADGLSAQLAAGNGERAEGRR